MQPKLIVGALPNQAIYKLHGYLYAGNESIKDSSEARSDLASRGAHFYPIQTIRDRIGKPICRQKELALDCTSCGACCCQRKGKRGMLINGIRPDEKESLEARRPGCVIPDKVYPNDLVLRKFPIRFQRIEACPFFSGRPGKSCSCSIYNHRPAVCRVFQPASDECLEIRHTFFHDYPNDPRSEKELAELNKLLIPQTLTPDQV